jgi:hypothetical protein
VRDPFAPLMTLDLPAGNYVVFASLQLENESDAIIGWNDRIISCRLQPEGAVYTWGTIGLEKWARLQAIGQLNLQGEVSFGSPRTVGVYCRWAETFIQADDVQVYLEGAHLTAIQVGSLTRQ